MSCGFKTRRTRRTPRAQKANLLVSLSLSPIISNNPHYVVLSKPRAQLLRSRAGEPRGLPEGGVGVSVSVFLWGLSRTMGLGIPLKAIISPV